MSSGTFSSFFWVRESGTFHSSVLTGASEQFAASGVVVEGTFHGASEFVSNFFYICTGRTLRFTDHPHKTQGLERSHIPSTLRQLHMVAEQLC